MNTELTIELSFDSDRQVWRAGVLCRSDGVIECVRSYTLGPFTTARDVETWVGRVVHTWAVPTLGVAASESLHDVVDARP